MKIKCMVASNNKDLTNTIFSLDSLEYMKDTINKYGVYIHSGHGLNDSIGQAIHAALIDNALWVHANISLHTIKGYITPAIKVNNATYAAQTNTFVYLDVFIVALAITAIPCDNILTKWEECNW